MQRLGDDLLPRAVLSCDQHICIRWPHPRHCLKNCSHRWSRGNKVRSTGRAQNAILRLQPLCSLLAAVQLHLVSKNAQEPRVLPRLLDEISSTAAHRLYCEIDVAPRGHYHYRQLSIYLLHTCYEVKPFLPRGCVTGVIQIDQQSVE